MKTNAIVVDGKVYELVEGYIFQSALLFNEDADIPEHYEFVGWELGFEIDGLIWTYHSPTEEKTESYND